MKALLGGFLVVSLLTGSMALAKTQEEQKQCQEKIDGQKEALRKAQDQFDLGEVTMIDVTDAKIAVADAVYSCAPYVKVNYCKYRGDLLRYKLGLVSSDNGPTGPIEDAIAKLKDFCIHPAQQQFQP